MSDLELYQENVLDYYKHPRNKEMLVGYTHTARKLNPLCGDDLTIYVKIQNGVVTKATFQGNGCAISQAAISMLTEKIIGMDIESLHTLSKEDIVMLLGIPITYTREKCAVLSLQVLQKSLMEEKKNRKLGD
jgi:nitrogen fixation protein NifU and related proteins